jgi:hypothetical protein
LKEEKQKFNEIMETQNEIMNFFKNYIENINVEEETLDLGKII